MTQFVHCRGCGVQIHETAPTCPKCGAPQGVTLAQTGNAFMQGGAPESWTSYEQVPWYRRRWFVIVCLWTLIPVAAWFAATGEFYYQGKDGTIKTLPKNVKVSTYLFSVSWFFLFFVPPESPVPLFHIAMIAVTSLVIGLKK